MIVTFFSLFLFELTKKILENGFAYESNGTIYFDVEKYHKDFGAKGMQYGILSGRVLEDQLETTRELDSQEEKRHKFDFALWKNAAPEHIMQWQSPWGMGFPGWHLECTCMSSKYLGATFDIHGGGMDLKFPHHECEIAQGIGITGKEPVKYWMHSNMLTVNGQKMSKSLGNSFLPAELFAGSHPLLEQAYSPMTVRFFMLQSQYRSTLDFSNDALKAAQKGFRRLTNGLRIAKTITFEPAEIAIDEKKKQDIEKSITAFYDAMNDDLNTAVAIAQLFNLLKYVNMIYMNQLQTAAIGEEAFNELKDKFALFIEGILGLKEEKAENSDAVLNGMLNLYREYKGAQQFDKVDEIRSYFKANGMSIKDMKHRIDWAWEE